MRGRHGAQTRPHLQSYLSSPREGVKRAPPGEADSSAALTPSATMTLIIAFKNTASRNICAVIRLGLCGGTSPPENRLGRLIIGTIVPGWAAHNELGRIQRG